MYIHVRVCMYECIHNDSDSDLLFCGDNVFNSRVLRVGIISDCLDVSETPRGQLMRADLAPPRRTS